MLIEALKSFGLTNHEAQIYIAVIHKGAQTGYEIANVTGIARANVYAVLSSLLDKGIVYKISEEPARYAAISPTELSAKILNSMENAAQVIIDNLKPQEPDHDLVVNLDGEDVILDKIIYLIDNARATIYLDAASVDLRLIATHLTRAQNRGVKVVIISLGKCPVTGMLVYENHSPASWIILEGRPIRLIIDSSLMVTGELGRAKLSRGLYSSNTTLVMMAKHSFTEEIILAEVRAKFGKELEAYFGPDFDNIKRKVSNIKRGE